MAGCQEQTKTTAPRASPVPTTAAAGPVEATVVAVGDLACKPGQPAEPGVCQQEATAKLAQDMNPDVVVAVGDLQYESGALAGFRTSYEASWGRLKDITRPAVGNHEYGTKGAAGYWDYFGDRAGTRGQGWYSFDIGSWHVVALNSNCKVVGCDAVSEQVRWLKSDLDANPADCTLAFWHHPRYSSGYHGSDLALEPIWSVLRDGGADVAIGGHDHHYERFAPQSTGAKADPEGIRQFVVGTGGRSLYPRLGRAPNSEAGTSGSFGVLELKLRSKGYDWRFASVLDDYTDTGSAICDKG